ncbi:hypothetical protein [Algibacter sp. R77976]|uniref:hypothetical protein n=1 Tax=Algibacter sp. R77976 TaxID=3093873 RepID=UPI0037C6A158
MKRPTLKITPKFIILFISALLLFSACGNYKKTVTTGSSINNTPKILFLNYSIENTSNGNKTIQFINKKIVDGKLKNNSLQPIETGTEDDLILTVLDKKSKTLNHILIKNPLIKRIEYIDDAKNFKTKTIKSDKGQFSIRLQLKSNAKYITISNFAKNEPLIKTQIN